MACCKWICSVSIAHQRIRKLLLVLSLFTTVVYYQISSSFPQTYQKSVKYFDFRDFGVRNTIYVITPTYTRSTQHPDLLRLMHTLVQVEDIHWIVVEDAQNTTLFVADFLKSSGLRYTHMSMATPEADIKISVKGRVQRNLALSWLKKHTTKGFFYFADDDNTYSLELFHELRKTTKIGIWPTGNMKVTGISSPIVINGKIIGFLDPFPKRDFPLDMASIGFSVRFWLSRRAPLFINITHGNLESKFLQAMKVKLSDFDILGQNCTQTLAWHTKTELVNHTEKTLPLKFQKSNLPALMQTVVIDELVPPWIPLNPLEEDRPFYRLLRKQ